jgi:hypothetical protein
MLGRGERGHQAWRGTLICVVPDRAHGGRSVVESQRHVDLAENGVGEGWADGVDLRMQQSVSERWPTASGSTSPNTRSQSGPWPSLASIQPVHFSGVAYASEARGRGQPISEGIYRFALGRRGDATLKASARRPAASLRSQ